MTARVNITLRLPACLPTRVGGEHGCRTAIEASKGLNGIALRKTNSTKAERGRGVRARSPWAAIAVAVLAVAVVLGAELWAARHAPQTDGSVASEVATEVSATLGDVAASSILIDP